MSVSCQAVVRAKIAGRLNLTASIARNMTGRMIKNMQVPAYWPALLGVQALEYKGVTVEVKKTMAISAIDMVIPPPMEPPMSI